MARTALVPEAASTSARSGRVALYAGAGAELAHYEVDVANATLIKRGAVTLPANVQYAWPHQSGHYLYVASSNGGPRASGDKHYASAFRIELATGALTARGAVVPLHARPIHLATDIPSAHVLIAYNLPSSLTVHRLNADGTLGNEVQQPAPLDTGIYAHQVRVDPSGRCAVLVTRGNSAAGGKPEDPGALKIFDYRDGVLTNRSSFAPHGGYGYGPRHLDFHPDGPWLFVSLERQNKLCAYKLQDGPVEPQLLYTRETLIDAGQQRPSQLAGTLHVHPNGRTLYVANRASGTTEVAGQKVFAGGENNIAVYAVDPATGEPSLIQHADTRGLQPRTFALDPSGRLLVVANAISLKVQDLAHVISVPASLAVFRIGDDGRLDYVRKYDVEAGGSTLFWMGMVGL